MGASGFTSYFLSLVFFLRFSYVLPQEQEISQQPVGSAFDVGPIAGCQVPLTTYCTDITYEVPASIAELTEFIEFELRNIVDPEDGQRDPGAGDCRDVYKQTLCRNRFPRCSTQNNQVYFEASENCEERLRESCADRASSVIKLGYCNSTQLNLHSGSCQRLSSYDQAGELQHCNLLDRDILVSDWMYEHIRQVDLKLQQDFPLILSSQSECWERYRNFLCSAVGQCVGSRIQLINTQETCEAVLNCYSDDISMVLSDLLACQPWPSEQQRHRPVPGSISPTPVAPESPASQQQVPDSDPSDDHFGWVQPSDRTFEFSSSMRTSVWSFFAVTTVIANLCFV